MLKLPNLSLIGVRSMSSKETKQPKTARIRVIKMDKDSKKINFYFNNKNWEKEFQAIFGDSVIEM